MFVSTILLPPRHPDRLPVLRLCADAWRRSAASARPLARFAVGPFILLVILEGGIRQAAGVAETWIDVTILSALQAIAQAVLLTPLTVAAYRLFMFGRGTVARDAIDDFPPGTAPILAISLLFALALLPLGDLYTLIENEPALNPAITLAYYAFVMAGFALYVLLVVRTLFLFNQAAAGHDLNLSLAWRQTRGHGWRLLALIALVALPWAGLIGVIDWYVLDALGFVPDFSDWSVWAGLLGIAAALVAMTVLVAAAGTFAHAHLTGFPLPGEHSGRAYQYSLPLDAATPPASSESA